MTKDGPQFGMAEDAAESNLQKPKNQTPTTPVITNPDPETHHTTKLGEHTLKQLQQPQHTTHEQGTIRDHNDHHHGNKHNTIINQEEDRDHKHTTGQTIDHASILTNVQNPTEDKTGYHMTRIPKQRRTLE